MRIVNINKILNKENNLNMSKIYNLNRKNLYENNKLKENLRIII